MPLEAGEEDREGGDQDVANAGEERLEDLSMQPLLIGPGGGRLDGVDLRTWHSVNSLRDLADQVPQRRPLETDPLYRRIAVERRFNDGKLGAPTIKKARFFQVGFLAVGAYLREKGRDGSPRWALGFQFQHDGDTGAWIYEADFEDGKKILAEPGVWEWNRTGRQWHYRARI